MDDGALVGAGSHSPYGCIIVMCSSFTKEL
jgi:hypothetical protein